MSTTKKKRRPKAERNSRHPNIKAPADDVMPETALATDTDFADADEVPEASTIAELKEAAKSPQRPKRKVPKVASTKTPAEETSQSVSAGKQSMMWVVRVLLAGAWLMMLWIISLFSAVSVVPNLFVMIDQNVDVNFDEAPLQVLLVGWIAPSVFLSAVLLFLVIAAAKAAWRFQIRIGDKVKTKLYT